MMFFGFILALVILVGTVIRTRIRNKKKQGEETEARLHQRGPKSSEIPASERMKGYWEYAWTSFKKAFGGTDSKLPHVLLILLLWGIFHIVLYTSAPEDWKWWFEDRAFFWGTNLGVITLPILLTIFRTERNKSAINIVSAILLIALILGFHRELQDRSYPPFWNDVARVAAPASERKKEAPLRTTTVSNRVIRAGNKFTITLRGPDDLRIYDIQPNTRIEYLRFYADRGLTVKVRQIDPAGVWLSHTYAPNDKTWVDFPNFDKIRFSSPSLAPKETQKVIVTAEKYKPARE